MLLSFGYFVSTGLGSERWGPAAALRHTRRLGGCRVEKALCDHKYVRTQAVDKDRRAFQECENSFLLELAVIWNLRVFIIQAAE